MSCQEEMMEEHQAQLSLPWPWVPVQRLRPWQDSFFVEGYELCTAAFKQVPVDDQEETPHTSVPVFPCHVCGCKKEFSTISSYEMHYNSHHRNVCSECRRMFPTNHLLDIHILESHDTMFSLLAAKQNMYQCLVETCCEKFASEQTRKDHLVRHHQYPANFRFSRKLKVRHKKSKENDNKSVDLESMDIGQNEPMETNKISASRKFTYRVPQNISFGHGVRRGFQRGGLGSRGRGRHKKKHWHQQEHESDTTVSIENIDMQDIAASLDTS